jgi:8-oxo-dGTP pyrophosphatase MutT (NUDIX family)
MPRSADLEALLRAYTPADGAERAHHARMLALLGDGRDAFARTRFEPGHFTASGFVLSPDARALLLVHHRKLDRWLQPGGHVEPDDPDIAAAARRELREEVGLADAPLAQAGVFDLDVHAIPPLGREPAHEHFDVRLLFRAPSLSLRPSAETKAARFVQLEAISELGTDDSVLRAVRKLAVLLRAAPPRSK